MFCAQHFLFTVLCGQQPCVLTYDWSAVVVQGIGWLVSHEEDLSDFLSMSALLSQPARSPAHAACRDSYLATLDFVEALCETSSNLTRFPPVSMYVAHVL